MLGGTRLQTLWRITAPLLRTSVLATWCFVFIGTIRELSATILLTTSNTKLVSVLIYDLMTRGTIEREVLMRHEKKLSIQEALMLARATRQSDTITNVW